MRLAKGLKSFLGCLIIVSVAVFMCQGLVWAGSRASTSVKNLQGGNGNNGNKGMMANGIVIKDGGSFKSFIIQDKNAGKRGTFRNLSKADRVKLHHYLASKGRSGKWTSVSKSELMEVLGKKLKMPDKIMR